MDFQSLQKLRFFLAIVFPFVGRNLITPEQREWLSSPAPEIVTHTRAQLETGHEPAAFERDLWYG